MISRSNDSNPVIAAASLGDADALKTALQSDFAKKTRNEALLAAAEHGHINIVELLVTYGAKLTYQSAEDGATAIAFAAQTGNIALFDTLKTKGTRLDVRCKDGSTLLMLAAEHGCMPLVNELLNLGFDPAEQDAQGDTALMRAARKNNIEVMTALLEHSPDSLLKINHADETALGVASHPSTVEIMLKTALTSAINNKNVNLVDLIYLAQKEKHNLNNLLRTAIKANNAPACQVLLENGADANLDLMNDGWTPLMLAAAYGNKEIAEALLNHHANPRFTDTTDWTPLRVAASRAHADVIQLLLDQGIDSNTPCVDGETALMTVIYYGTDKKTYPETNYSSTEASVRILLEKGADVNLTDANDDTALTMAVDVEDATTVSMLLNHRGASQLAWVDIEKAYALAKERKHAQTIQAFKDHFRIGQALIGATRNKKIDDVQEILSEGAAADTPNSRGYTALHAAAANNTPPDIAQLLISKRANVNRLDRIRWTPLMCAARYQGDLAMMQYLIEQGAQINCCQQDDWTALMMAARNRNENILKFLIDKGASIHNKSKKGWYAVLLAALNKNRASVSLLFKAGAIIDDAPAATEKLKKSSGDKTAVNILFEGLVDNIKENIHQLFSNTLTAEQFSELLADTNKKTAYLVDQKGFRKLVRNEIIFCTEEAKKSLDAQNNENALGEIQGKMQMLADQLTIIQKTESDTSEKTAKKKLLNLIADISEKIGAAPAKPEEKVVNAESKALFDILSNLQNRKIEKIIAENLLKIPDEEMRKALRLFLSELNSRTRDQIKQHLFQAIKTVADEPKMEEDTNDELTINKIKKAFDEKQRPILFEILRAHESGTADKDTGTWKKLERLMQQGAFLSVRQPKVSLTSPFKRFMSSGATTEQEMKSFKNQPN